MTSSFCLGEREIKERDEQAVLGVSQRLFLKACHPTVKRCLHFWGLSYHYPNLPLLAALLPSSAPSLGSLGSWKEMSRKAQIHNTMAMGTDMQLMQTLPTVTAPWKPQRLCDNLALTILLSFHLGAVLNSAGDQAVLGDGAQISPKCHGPLSLDWSQRDLCFNVIVILCLELDNHRNLCLYQSPLGGPYSLR